MKLLPNIFNHGLLKNSGDSLSAKITKSGRQVLKLHTHSGKRSWTRYPSSGTIVGTFVRKR